MEKRQGPKVKLRRGLRLDTSPTRERGTLAPDIAVRDIDVTKRTESNHYDVEAFYDGDCPLCRREMNLLKRWDRRERIRFTDISDPGFQPDSVGKSFDELMARMQGR